MSDTDDEDVTSQKDATEEVEKTEAVEDDSAQDDSEDVETLKEKNKKLFERAKKAEAEAKELKTKVKPPEKKPQTVEKQTGELSAKDIILLSSSGIKESEDLDEVIDFAKYKNISISEALNHSTIKTILAERAETRKTAEATNTSGSRRVTTKITDETLLANAQSKGQLPEDEGDMQRIVKKRLGIKT